MRGVLIQKQLSSQIIKTLTFALPKKWSSVHGENFSHTEKCSTCKDIWYHVRYHGAGQEELSEERLNTVLPL